MRHNFLLQLFCSLILSSNTLCAFAFGLNPNKPLTIPSPFAKDDIMVSYSTLFGNGITHQLRVDYFVHERWSLLYNAGYAYRAPTAGFVADDSYREYRAPLGLSLGVAVTGVVFAGCSYSGGDGVFNFIMLTSLIPDGVAYHIAASERLDISPYLLLSGLTYQINGENDGQFVYAPMAGLRLLYHLNDTFVISAEQNIKRGADDEIIPSAGATLAIVF